MSKEEKEVTRKEWDRRAFLSFGVFGLFGLGIYGIRQWIVNAPDQDGVHGPLRRILEFNGSVGRGIKSDRHLAQEYPLSMAAVKVRLNGDLGLKEEQNMDEWRLTVLPHGNMKAPRQITLAEMRSLPKTEIIFDFKCIEGWSQISHWGGVRVKDLLGHFNLGTRNGSVPSSERPDDLYTYIALRTPDGKYYVGIDMSSALHPQTILAYEMNGEPLQTGHGAPLRLIIPTKYGVKHLKRIGTMAFMDERPPDYWAERGYDYDSGL
jgi:DMSO/TMAO reductase YedYZ molybdopterin-dependent catalytic subunit